MDISVIVPVYNREKTIKRCINSIINQKLSVFEIIVVDDGSTDKTIEIVNEFEGNIKIIRQNHRGAQAARNLGILNAKGDYIAFLDSDDEWLPQMLEKTVDCLLKHHNNCIVYTDCYIQRETGRRTWRLPECGGDSYFSLLKSPGPMFQSMLVKKEILMKICLLDENIVSYQEWDTAIRLAKFVEFVHVREPLFIYHLHKGETISKDKNREIKGYGYIVKKHKNEIIRLHGLQVLKSHYCHLLYLCLNYKNKKKMYFRFEILKINLMLELEKLQKRIE